MQDAPEERLKILCGRVADGQNPDKLLALIQEINNLLEEKRSRLPSAGLLPCGCSGARPQNSCIGVQEVLYGESDFQE
jgi:hypothetical protein